MSTDVPNPTPTPHIQPESENDVPGRDVKELGDDEDLPSIPEPGSDVVDPEPDGDGPSILPAGAHPTDWGWHQQDEQN